MRTLYATALALVLVASASVGAADGPRGLPTPKLVEEEKKPLPPNAKIRLAGDAMYVADFAEDCIMRAHPAGLVKITKLAGPVNYRAKFADGNGKIETRKYVGKVVFEVEAVGTGVVEIDVIPLGLKSEEDIKSATIDVDTGTAPIPPPKPTPDPKVDPKPVDPPKPAPIVADGLRVLVVYKANDNAMSEDQKAIIFGGKARTFLNDTVGAGKYRIWPDGSDASAAEKVWRDAFARPRGAANWVIVSNGATGTEEPLPATDDEFIAIVKKYAK